MIKTYSKFHKLTICDGLEALTTKNYNLSFPFHFHQTYNISLVYDGTFRARVPGKNLYAQPGAILITNPHEIHANPSEINEYVSFFTFYISADFFNYSNQNKPIVFPENIIYDDDVFKSLHQVAVKIEAGGTSLAIEQQLADTLNELSFKHGFFNAAAAGLDSDDSLFKEYLANEDFDKFSLDRSAKQFGIDKFKFLRLFKFQTGLTPNNYFILKRIEKSKEMLFAGNDLLRVAIDLGFYDIPHFANHFKKFTGISPAAYSAAMVLSKDGLG